MIAAPNLGLRVNVRQRLHLRRVGGGLRDQVLIGLGEEVEPHAERLADARDLFAQRGAHEEHDERLHALEVRVCASGRTGGVAGRVIGREK